MRIDPIVCRARGGELTLRCAEEPDAEALLRYLKTTCDESRFLARDGADVTMTVEEEQAFIRSTLESPSHLMLLGFAGGEHVGNVSIMGSGGRSRHRCSLGIALYKKYTGQGYGRVMLREILRLAREKGWEQMELEVVAENENAIALYKSEGFVETGRIPRCMKYRDGSYADGLFMVKEL